jgi:UDP-4-amino-4,6-dideoxy-N-acetyl-beta-L-altrosamine transaminase
MIPYSRQEIDQTDIDSVVEVLRSNWLTQGPTVPMFEDAVVKYSGSAYGVAVNSATSALHIACIALDVRPGDWVWTTPNTFVASANCALHCGANIDFVDIDPFTYNLSIDRLIEKLQLAKVSNKLPKVIIPVHYAGQSCDMIAIHKLSQEYGFKIIEDASHALGSLYKKTKVGSCKYSHITVFSFHPIKIITTIEGGMAMTNDVKLAERMSRLKTHGITSKKLFMKSQPSNEIWNYQQIELGFNYRMNDVQAALGLSQLKNLHKFIQRRQDIAKYYDTELKNLPITTPWQLPETFSSYHLYPIRIEEGINKKTQREVFNFLWQKGVAVNLHYIPVHRQPYYESLGFKKGKFPEAEKFHREAISIPIFTLLTENQQNFIISALKECFNK